MRSPHWREEFVRLKVEGIRECAEVLVACLRNGRERYVLGRRTMPETEGWEQRRPLADILGRDYWD